MKLGFNLLLHTAFVTEEHTGVLEQLRANGYQGVEIPLLQGDKPHHLQGDEPHYAQLGEVIRRIGLECTCVTALPGLEANPISADATSRQAGCDFLLRCVDMTATLGGTVLCGPTYQALGEFSGTGPTQDELKRARDIHQIVADHAAKSDIVLAFEPLNRFESYLLNTQDDGAAHAKEVDRPNVGILFDTFHANIEEKSVAGSLKRNLGAVRHVHLSENDRGIPGTGHIDFPAVLETLHQASYKDWVVVEAFGRSLPELAAATRIWRDLFTSPEEVVERSAKYLLPLLS